ncbi:2OG-Fe(II) oxygenase family enzyme [Synechococcus phage S-RIM2]|jgi:hypothetical protein|uniref:2OG-Fe(II) oxygenase family enzyme n=4 Tax=Nerrivikvirus srim2 TaxID=2734125 RepID=A0A1D7RKJ1_9CAUD|nr:2OG-Fe(II) oxygenase [Synechococcus phage S-RIM2 R1_1999]AGH06808.1 2OG-Fe(II) oxygenase [Synechococcus phage S-RIM2 R21_2007]AGH07018.1 2OG-Fe(II) oxygenase [Synechococcus phage S-RIM2 R9_2006]AON97640.1 2OG-Fe(II) oxygenase family enzyme [Synechococcus phage S-RIM2]AGH07229.1 2OG-Fe(II) oxygenase [Synechococcus phage S-RIM2 R1_1999]AON97854.1 2OG-Fe(II) oxygenase family enzyme [Synechococcus phage S-RIM2]
MITDFYFEDFIGVFDTEYDTSDLIEYWEYQNKVGATFKRKGLFGKERKANIRTDTALVTEEFMLDHSCGYEYMRAYNQVVGACLEHYVDKYEQLLTYRYQQVYLNVQKTLPQQGYHSWHDEKSSMGCNRRIAATMMYLNNVEEGGETEFLYLAKRFKPVRGRVLIWPAGFTHVHRGNPPLSGEKYIATSWLENINA